MIWHVLLIVGWVVIAFIGWLIAVLLLAVGMGRWLRASRHRMEAENGSENKGGERSER